jgi:hypothetical protein
VWIKERSSTSSHNLFDAIRGATNGLASNLTSDEFTGVDSLTAFDSDGFSLGAGGTVNENTQTYVAWNWKAGNSNVTNTDGTITSTVRANPTAGFSIVTYTGTGANATVGHGIGVAPSVLIVKQRSSTTPWSVYHRAGNNPANVFYELNTTSAGITASTVFGANPTSTVFSIGTDTNTNASGGTYVCYAFAPVAGYSAFGSYTGNGSADGPFQYLGFRPAFIIVKATSATGNWQVLDTARSPANAADKFLRANTNIAENTNYPVDILSNGFKMRNTDSDYQSNGTTYIWVAFAENPFQYALAR